MKTLKRPTVRLQRVRSYLSRLLGLLILTGVISGCGSGGGSHATAKFCNNLEYSSSGFTAYLSIAGGNTSEFWTAYTGSCTSCGNLTAGLALAFELGDNDSGTWLERFNKVLEINGQYEFSAEIDSTGNPGIVSYRPVAGYTCATM